MNSPAFPTSTFDGMTLRDWFAGQALAGLISNERVGQVITFSEYAEDAYSYADAMLCAREETRP